MQEVHNVVTSLLSSR